MSLGVVAIAVTLLTAAGYYGGTNPNLSAGSSIGVTNTTSLATNGAYTVALGAAGAVFQGTETNLVALNPNLDGNYGVLTISGQGLTAASANVGTTNMVVVISSVPKGTKVTITNNAANGWGSASQPRSVYGTFTLTLNGNVPVLTNITLHPGSSPPFTKGLQLFLETVQFNGSNQFFTNWGVSFRQDVGN